MPRIAGSKNKYKTERNDKGKKRMLRKNTLTFKETIAYENFEENLKTEPMGRTVLKQPEEDNDQYYRDIDIDNLDPRTRQLIQLRHDPGLWKKLTAEQNKLFVEFLKEYDWLVQERATNALLHKGV